MPRIGLGELFQAGGGVEGIGRARERRTSAGPEALGIGSPFGERAEQLFVVAAQRGISGTRGVRRNAAPPTRSS